MLEDPAYSEVVRWGDQGDSFVVLEVLPLQNLLHISYLIIAILWLMINATEREIYQDDITQTL
jgi:hypothetical protein